MARPSAAAFRFATASGVRSAVSAARKLSGWVGGEPVGQGEQNDVLGMLSDWVEYLSGLGPANVLKKVRLMAGDGPWLAADADSLVKSNSAVEIRIESNTGTDAIAYRGWGPIAVGGTISSITAEVEGQNGADYDIEVTLRGWDSAGAVRNRGWAVTGGSSTGTITLTQIDGIDEIFGPITVSAKLKAPHSGGYVEVSTLTLTWA